MREIRTLGGMIGLVRIMPGGHFLSDALGGLAEQPTAVSLDEPARLLGQIRRCATYMKKGAPITRRLCLIQASSRRFIRQW
jgi:hypothetical protein